MKVLFIGDVVGRPGRNCLRDLLPKIKENYAIDLSVANCENAAGGKGLTKKVVNEIYESGVNVITSGNHIWDKKEIFKFIDKESHLLRPANYPPKTPGSEYGVYNVGGVNVGIINLSGRVFMTALDCPFRKADEILDKIANTCNIILLDFHAEATSEKMALAKYLDGRVSALLGTHTHVQTADEQILPDKTAYITDVGMTGPFDSILGVESEPIVDKFVKQLPTQFEVAEGKVQFNGAILDIDIDTGICKNIQRIQDLHEF